MNNLTLTHSVEGENAKLFTEMIEKLGEIISDKDIYKFREEKGTLIEEEGELEKIEGIDGDNNLHKKTISFSYEELRDIKNLKDLRRFVIKYKDIIKSNIQKKYPDFYFYEEEFEKYDSYSDDKETKKNNIKIALDNNELFIKNLLKFLGYPEQQKIEKIGQKEKSEQFARISDKIAENILAQVGNNGAENNFSEIPDKELKKELEKIKKSIDNRKKGINKNKEFILQKLNKVGIILGKNIGIKEYKNLIKYVEKDRNNLILIFDLYREYRDDLLKVFKGSSEFIELFFTEDFQDFLEKLEDKEFFIQFIIEKGDMDRFMEFYANNKEKLIWFLKNFPPTILYLNGCEVGYEPTSDDFIKAYEENKRNQKTENLREQLAGNVDFSLENKRFRKIGSKVFNFKDENLRLSGNKYIIKTYLLITKDKIKEKYKEKVLESLANEESIPSVDDFYKEYVKEEDVPENIEKYLLENIFEILKPVLTGIRNSIVFAYNEINKKNLS